MQPRGEFHAHAVKWRDVVGELSQLFPQHFAEGIGTGMALNINYRAYEQAERSGALLIVGLWRGDSLVGYWTLLVSPFLHSMSHRAAHTDLLYVVPAARSRVAWKTLCKAVQEILLAKGVDFWFVGSKAKRPIGALLEREGFTLEELSYVKRL